MTEGMRAQAGDLVLTAARIRAEELGRHAGQNAAPGIAHADRTEARARAPLPESMAERGAGGELIPVEAFGYKAPELRAKIEAPTWVEAEASRDRLQAAEDAGCLDAALDMADSINARDNLERALAHQLAAAHRSAMTLTRHMNRCLETMEYSRGAEREAANVQATRLANATARLMGAFQQGALTLDRLRNGGKQVVQVQHVTVAEGGQAIVAGEVSAGGKGQRRKEAESAK